MPQAISANGKTARARHLAIFALTMVMHSMACAQTDTSDQNTAPAQGPEDMCLFGTICAQSEAPPTKPGPVNLPISAYKENYFNLAVKNLGPKDPSPWEFKLGLKAPLYVARDSGEGLYFTYRMTGYWDIDATSAPFRDINHNPGFVWLNQKPNASGWLRGYEWGLEHISNGQDNTSTGPNGSGTNRSRSIAAAFFVEPRLHLFGDKFVYQPRLWIPIGTHDNAEIRSQWGLFWQTLSWRDTLEIGTKGNPFRKGLATLKLHAPLTLLMPWRRTDDHESALKVTLTVFNGYGDGLLEYRERRTWARLGLTFSLYKN